MRDANWEETYSERGMRGGDRGGFMGQSGSGSLKSSNPYEIDYEDKRFTDVEAEKDKALADVDATYGEMIGKSDSFYNEQIQASKDWEEQQKKSQQEMTDFTIEQIEQQKERAEEDYLREQSGAYKDWQKQSNQYGANAEKIASQGMGGTGYSESTQAAMYNTYQFRVAAAREAFVRATQDYDNDMKEAQLQNNSVMAQIAFEAYQKRLELALAGFQYKNQLIIEQSDKKLQVDSLYYQRWQDVLAQMNTENSLAEQIRQFNESIALEREQFEFQKMQYMEDSGGSGGGGGYSGSGSSDGDYLLPPNTAKNNNQAEVWASDAPVDMNSVNALGYGDISAVKLLNKVEQGTVHMYEDDGTKKFANVNKPSGGGNTRVTK